MSGIQPSDCFKLARNPKNDNDVTIFRHDVNVKLFWRCFVSPVKFSYWSKFYVNIITGSGIMTIFFYKGLTRNPEIESTLVWVLPNIWRLGRVMDTKFGTNVSNKRYWILQNSRVTAFTVLELLRENHSGGWLKLPPLPLPATQIRVKRRQVSV